MRRLLLVLWLACASFLANAAEQQTVARNELPIEAQQTLQRIDRGGPFPYRRDGIVFGNYEKRLPAKARGYYHEYTVPPPGHAAHNSRGARRIVTGKVSETYYTDDHYRSFKRIRE